MANNVQQRLHDLRDRLNNLPDGAEAQMIAALEREARALLVDAKNTPHEAHAQDIFAEIARIGTPHQQPETDVSSLVRRARIRIEVAASDDDIDEAIDILSEALTIDRHDDDMIDLLQQAARRSSQAAQRVSDLFARYQIAADVHAAATYYDDYDDQSEILSEDESFTAYNPSTESQHTTQEYPAHPASSQTTGNESDDLLSEVSQAYYAGDYQQAVDLANRVLVQEPNNYAALDYRQKAEDNLIRGVVPDHRIPFDARVAYNRANSLVRAGNYEEAENLYRQARDIAEDNGILSWKDAEQALLEIQDLALSRELLADGDRLMAADNWTEAIRKYEGALRVVPNDPQAEERIESARRVQQDIDQAASRVATLSGSLADQSAQLQHLFGLLARVRQRLPNSQRVATLTQDVENKVNAIKMQLRDQVHATLARADSTTAIDQRLSLTYEALQSLEYAVELDPSDSELSQMLIDMRVAHSEMERARQTIERAAGLIVQNFDNDLAQARSMLAGLEQYNQDERYLSVAGDLMARYIERTDDAITTGNLREARAWADTLRDDPFPILARRSELRHIENGITALRNRNRMRVAGATGIIIVIIIVALFASRPAWSPALFPPPTDTPTPTFTPSLTFTPSQTFTPTSTHTPTSTPTFTLTPSPTVTPSFTVTASLTASHTITPTHTATITPTFTPSITPTPSETPMPTPTQPILCRVFVQSLNEVNVRTMPSVTSRRLGGIPSGTAMDVVAQEIGPNDGRVWYRIAVEIDDSQIEGWVRSDTVVEIADCPELP